MPAYWERDLVERGGANQKRKGKKLLENQRRGKLASCLLELFAWGLLSAATVQWLAAAAALERDGSRGVWYRTLELGILAPF